MDGCNYVRMVPSLHDQSTLNCTINFVHVCLEQTWSRLICVCKWPIYKEILAEINNSWNYEWGSQFSTIPMFWDWNTHTRTKQLPEFVITIGRFSCDLLFQLKKQSDAADVFVKTSTATWITSPTLPKKHRPSQLQTRLCSRHLPIQP